MIVVEGTDNLGKTTLCNALVKEINARGLPHVYTHFGKLSDSFDRVWDYLPHMNPCVVMDRFYMSRQAYGKALKNQRTLNFEQYRLLDAWLRMHRGYTVLVVASDDRLKDDWLGDRGKPELYTLDQAVKVNAQFKKCRSLLECDIDYYIELDLSDDEIEWPSNHVDAIINAYMDRWVGFDRIADHRPTARQLGLMP